MIFFLALVMLPDSSKQTVTIGIALFNTQFRTGGPTVAAGSIIDAIPVLMVFIAGQRFIRAGLFAGGC